MLCSPASTGTEVPGGGTPVLINLSPLIRTPPTESSIGFMVIEVSDVTVVDCEDLHTYPHGRINKGQRPGVVVAEHVSSVICCGECLAVHSDTYCTLVIKWLVQLHQGTIYQHVSEEQSAVRILTPANDVEVQQLLLEGRYAAN